MVRLKQEASRGFGHELARPTRVEHVLPGRSFDGVGEGLGGVLVDRLFAGGETYRSPSATIFGERLYYAPNLGLALAAAWGWNVLSTRPRLARTGAAACGLGCLACALVVLQRNPVWDDDRTLFYNEVRVQPESVRMQMCAATYLAEEGRVPEALGHLLRAVELEPEYALAWNNLAANYLGTGRLRDAEYCAERGLLAAHVMQEDLYKLRTNLGFVLAITGREAEGMHELGEVLRLQPNFHRARIDLLTLLTGFGADAEIEHVLAGGERLAPQHDAWPIFHGFLAHRHAEWERAAALLETALAKPRWSHRANRHLVWYVHADSLARSGRVARAAQLSEDARVPIEFRTRAAQRLESLDALR